MPGILINSTLSLATRAASRCGVTSRVGSVAGIRGCVDNNKQWGMRIEAKQKNFTNVGIGFTRVVVERASVRNVRRCGTVVRAEEESGGSSPSSDTLSSLSSILGDDDEAERKKKEEEEEREREIMKAKREQAAKNQEAAPKIFNNAATSTDGSADSSAAQRGLAAISYLLPLLDGLKYSKFLLMQFPLFGLALLPLKPVIDLWYALGFLQIIVFFGLFLGVVNNQEMNRFVRFNAQQAILLDILLIVPDLLTRAVSGLGGDDAMLTGGPGLEAQVLLYNTVFLYVYLTCIVGAGSSALGKQVKLPLVGDASEQQIR